MWRDATSNETTDPSRQLPIDTLLQSAIDSLPSHIALLDETGRIIRINEAWRRFGENNGYRDQAFGLGRNYVQVCQDAAQRNAEGAGQVADGISAILSERSRLYRAEYPCHSPSQQRWFTLQIARFEWENQLRVITVHQDVSNLKYTQRALEQTHQRLEAIVQTVADGIFTADECGIIQSLNPAMETLFDYRQADLIGQPITVLLGEEDCSYYVDLFNHSHRVTFPNRRHEVQGITRTGASVPLDIALSRTKLGATWLYTGMIYDLTPRKHMESALLSQQATQLQLNKQLELNELKSRFMSMISHELRTPLSIMMLSSDFLKRYEHRMSEAERMECISTIQTQIQQMEELVNDVGILSRSEGEFGKLQRDQVDLIDFCRNVIANMRILDEDAHPIVLHTQMPHFEMWVDAKLMRQIFNNLIGNAIKYSPPKSVVNVVIRLVHTELLIEVSDKGIGIPTADHAHLFEPFFRASNVGVCSGTGLGLAVTKRAVELHGGKIGFRSLPNGGTTFHIHLPLDPSP